MAGYGARKGSNNGGGRIKGQRKGETRVQAIERMTMENAPGTVEEVVRTHTAAGHHRKLAKDVLGEAMNFFYGLAAKYQPTEGNATADERKFLTFLDKTADIAAKLAPFESPKLSNVTQVQAPLDMSRFTVPELEEFERLLAKAAQPAGGTGGAGETTH